MTADEADVVVVGSGISGVLVARELLRAGKRVVVLERGGLRTHDQQLADGRYETDAAGAQHSHVKAPGSPDYPWNYVFGVGGASLHWSGVTPRLGADDLTMRSSYGVMQDWPVTLEALEPHYRRAERLLGVAGAPDGEGALPPHPFSPMDRVLEAPLAPYVPLPQARPTRAVGRRPPCCASGSCELCPVDSRFTVLNGLGDVLDDPGLELRTESAVERVLLDGRRAVGVAGVGAGGRRFEVRAPQVVLAASGFENPAVLLRSGLDRPATGRFLYDHAHRTITVRLRRDVGPGVGASIATGASNAFRSGAFRAERCAAYLSAYNPGVPPSGVLADRLAAGASGREAREAWLDVRRRSVVLDVLLEDVPRPERRVTLGRRRDAVGLLAPQVAYGPPGPYEQAGGRAVREAIAERLRPLGVEDVSDVPGPAGSHLLGTCRMGSGRDAVVDADLRHLDVEGLHVAGGSAFPTYSPVHPTLTIAALALRLGGHLADAA